VGSTTKILLDKETKICYNVSTKEKEIIIMTEFLITMICVAFLAVLCFGTWGITSLVYRCIDKRDRKKWDITVTQHPEVLDYQKDKKKWWEAYDQKSKEASGYQKQIDELLVNVCYLPSYEVQWRQDKAEEYRVLYFEARGEADKMYQLYLEAHKKVADYCKEHKLRRWF
jgi:hypothetical protein